MHLTFRQFGLMTIVMIALFLSTGLFGQNPKIFAAPQGQQANLPVCNGENATAGCVVCVDGVKQKPDGKRYVICKDKVNEKCNAENGCNLVEKYINPTINLLAISVGLLSVISIMIGGVQFASSDGDPQKAAAAKGRIAKTIVALVSFMFLYAFLQFLVPGGIFNG